MTDNLENQADTTLAVETAPEQGTVVENTEDTTQVETEPNVDAVDDKEAQKAEMRKNQLANTEKKAKEIEEATGLSLEDILLAARNESPEEDEELTTQNVPSEEFDKELFDNLVKDAVKKEYGSIFGQMKEFGQYAAKISSKEAVQKLPSDYKDFENDIGVFLKKNPSLALTDDGVKTAYYAVKGMKSDEISQKAADTKEKEINSKEEVKNLAFVESPKNDKTVKTTTNIEDILALSNDEYAKLPQEIKEQILRSL